MGVKEKRRTTKKARTSRDFNYELDYKKLDLRKHPELYRVGKGEQGVLLVEPYKSEILPHWRFRTPKDAKESAQAILKLFRGYKKIGDFVGMDMARKFIQMGYTRARRYANHKSGKKYSEKGEVLPREHDEVKAHSAQVFYDCWKKVEADRTYGKLKAQWKQELG